MNTTPVKLCFLLTLLAAIISCSPKEHKVATPSPYNVSGKDTISLASGLKYILVHKGEGIQPLPGQKVSVHYTGYLTNGTKFDSSADRGEPIRFPLGEGKVIQGWDEALMLLSVGSRARLIIPHELGYGTAGYPPLIPPSATLIFDVELMDVE
jgi:peptidylprolyl isomerase